MRVGVGFFAVLYFAYGSNLNQDDFARWCRARGHDGTGVRALEAAWLPDAELAFDYLSRTRGGGALDVRARRGAAVPGVLFEVDDAGWRALDAKEGAPDRYVRVERTVLTLRGDERQAWTYVVTPKHRREHAAPSDDYVSIVREGLARFGLPTHALDAAIEQRACSIGAMFVYGTLMRGEARHDLVAHGRALGSARVTGRLISLREYPGLVQGDGVVRGELIEIDASTLDALDEYEGFAGFGARSLFSRVIVAATVDDTIMHAWSYRYCGSAPGTVIESGDWRAR